MNTVFNQVRKIKEISPVFLIFHTMGPLIILLPLFINGSEFEHLTIFGISFVIMMAFWVVYIIGTFAILEQILVVLYFSIICLNLSYFIRLLINH